jgi:hypothetical protein
MNQVSVKVMEFTADPAEAKITVVLPSGLTVPVVSATIDVNKLGLQVRLNCATLN